ncbi:MAG: HD domain-containing protein [Bacteroidota bacterium]
MKYSLQENIDIEELLAPESEMERQLLGISEFRKGLLWGKPRYGHPEGKVVFHIREVLDNIDKLDISPANRKSLRLIAYVHDTFKYLEDKGKPRDWSKHHSILARDFIAQFTNDQVLLDIVVLHDEA